MTRSILAAGFVGTLLLLANVSDANAFSGRRLINAAGGVHETAAAETGSIGLSGMIDFDNKEGATAVHVTIALEDTGGDSINCVLSIPADVSYTLTGETGTLTLTVGAADACTAGNVGDSIKFNLVLLSASGNAGRITATSINLHDNMGDLVDLTSATGAISNQ